jgi:bis(5'-nucleosyl)-tetraphosphatase (symmetrical)
VACSAQFGASRDGYREAVPMTLAIGDVQGCQSCLQRLLADAGEDGSGRLWLTGDLVNRGPESLATLRWAMATGDRLVTVLGNHDLHLLAVAAGVHRPYRSDTLDAILAAADRDALLDWLRQRPLAVFEHGHLLVHAGVLPQWDVATVLKLAAEVQTELASSRWRECLASLYGDEPVHWHDDLHGPDRLRVIVNALTRLRVCSADGAMALHVKASPEEAPPGYGPWFDAPGRRTAEVTVVFGHWSTLGLVSRPNLLGLDTGCVWGGALTAVRLEDRAVRRVACPRAADPAPS